VQAVLRDMETGLMETEKALTGAGEALAHAEKVVPEGH